MSACGLWCKIPLSDTKVRSFQEIHKLSHVFLDFFNTFYNFLHFLVQKWRKRPSNQRITTSSIFIALERTLHHQ